MEADRKASQEAIKMTKEKSSDITTLELLEGIPDIDTLSDRLKLYLVVRPQCKTEQEACDIVKITPQRVWQVRTQNKAFRETEEYLKQRMIEEAARNFDNLVPNAVEAYAETIAGDEPRTKLSAARDVLKRHKIVEPEHRVQAGFAVIFPFEKKEIIESTDHRLIDEVSAASWPDGSPPVEGEDEGS